jgi:hypothetical protein
MVMMFAVITAAREKFYRAEARAFQGKVKGAFATIKEGAEGSLGDSVRCCLHKDSSYTFVQWVPQEEIFWH